MVPAWVFSGEKRSPVCKGKQSDRIIEDRAMSAILQDAIRKADSQPGKCIAHRIDCLEVLTIEKETDEQVVEQGKPVFPLSGFLYIP